MSELPARSGRGGRALRYAAGAAAVLALTATGLWALREPAAEPAAPMQQVNSIEVLPAPATAEAPPPPEPVPEVEKPEPKEEPKPQARASKAKSERRTETRVEVDPEFDMGLDEEDWKGLTTPPPGLTPQQRREFIRAMRKLQQQRVLRDAQQHKKNKVKPAEPVEPTPPAPEAP